MIAPSWGDLQLECYPKISRLRRTHLLTSHFYLQKDLDGNRLCSRIRKCCNVRRHNKESLPFHRDSSICSPCNSNRRWQYRTSSIGEPPIQQKRCTSESSWPFWSIQYINQNDRTKWRSGILFYVPRKLQFGRYIWSGASSLSECVSQYFFWGLLNRLVNMLIKHRSKDASK